MSRRPRTTACSQLLADGSDAEVAERRRRLADAVSGFDAATIATTHGFCQHVLAGLGVAGDVERDVTFVEDLSDLVEEVVDDLYVRRFHRVARPPFDRAEALRIGRAAVGNPLARLEPVERRPGDEAQTWAMRRRLAEAVRDEVEARKRRSGVMTYDDLLTRLRNTLADEEHGAAACAKLREQYRVALVDEFQDTDPIQWEIMRRAFGEGEATLILIGDPKQAVYSFRGADVYAYLSAADSAVARATLATNWRSDQGLIDALDALFDGAQLGHEGIVHRPVRAADANREPRLLDAPVDRPAARADPAPRRRARPADTERIRVEAGGGGRDRGRPGRRRRPRPVVVRDAGRPRSGRLRAPAGAGAAAPRRGARPHEQAGRTRRRRARARRRPGRDQRRRQRLRDPGRGRVAAAARGGRAAGLDRPRPVGRAHLLPRLERGADGRRGRAGLEELHAKLHRWAGLLRSRGVAALLDSISATEAVPRRVLARLGGERRLTDLGHVGQLLHTAATEQQLGVSSLTAWLRQRIADADRDSADEDRALRLDSDAEAVQVLTIHRSKGLEFPIVYHPFAWQPGYIDQDEPPAYHDDQNDDVWTIDVGGNGPDIARHRRLRDREQRGEDLRLLYVALTRTMHQATVWWAGSWESRNSSLGRLLFARRRRRRRARRGGVPATSCGIS